MIVDRLGLRDIYFNLFEVLHVEELNRLPAFHDFSQRMAKDAIEGFAKVAAERMAPGCPLADQEGCRFDRASGSVATSAGWREGAHALMKGGWMLLEPGGEFLLQGLPGPVAVGLWELGGRANNLAMAPPALTYSVARMLALAGSDELKRRYSPKLCSGEWTATMCLSEAGVGTAIGDIRTVARKDGERWRISGQKIFITCGEHDLSDNIVHTVLARIEGAPPGVRGLGVFLVPKRQIDEQGRLGATNGVRCLGLEEKMGQHAVPTVTLSFGEDEPCLGDLVGEPQGGLQVMFRVMNDMRLNVAVLATGMAAAAFSAAIEHATTRVQGTLAKDAKNPDATRVTIHRHPDVARMLATMKAISEGLRALTHFTALQMTLAQHDDHAGNDAQGLLDLLTPICKAYATSQAVRVIELSMLVHGGVGYVRRHGIEQLMRDSLVLPIYEGTNGIQAIDLLARKMPAKGGSAFVGLMQRISDFVEREKSGRGAKEVAALGRAREAVQETAMRFFAQQQSGALDLALLGASHFLAMMGDLICAWLLVEQGKVATAALTRLGVPLALGDETRRARLVADSEARFYDGKLRTVETFVNEVLPGLHAKAASCAEQSSAPLEIIWD